MPAKPLFYSSDAVVASPAAGAETVVCRVAGVATSYPGQQIKLAGELNLTPDTDATALVLRVRRRNVTGTLVTPAQTVGLGALAGGGATLLSTMDTATADAATVVDMDGAGHAVPTIIAAPPAWMDNAGHIIEAGLYAALTQVRIHTPPTAPALAAQVTGIFGSQSIEGVDGVVTLGSVDALDIISLGAADLPNTATAAVTADNDATGELDVQTTIRRLAAPVGGAGGEVAPDLGAINVVDSPAQLAGGVYVLTAQLTGANSPSVVNAVALTARVD